MKSKILSRLLPVLLLLAASTAGAEEVSKRIFLQESDFKFDEKILDFTVQTKKGSSYSERMVDDDVKRLTARGVFADVSASVRKMPDGTVEVTFRMVAKPVVSGVRFEGNKLIPEKKLREALCFSLQTPQNDAQIIVSADRIRNLYKEAGRDATTVTLRLDTKPDGTVEVVFRIAEEMRIRINSVNFTGNTVYDAAGLRDSLETRYFPLSASWLSWIPVRNKPGLLDKKALDRDKLRLRELYWRKGHLDFKIKDIRITELAGDPEMVDVQFDLEEGEPYFVGSVRVRGNAAFPTETVRKCIRQTTDNVYNVRIEEQDLERLEALYAPEGYADLRVDVEKFRNYKTHTVDLEYRVHEGPQYTIGEIVITGNKRTKAHVILRELPIKPNDKVDRRKLEISKSRLMGMNYFADPEGGGPGVEITAGNSSEPGKKDIHIDVKEKRFLNGKIGAGWSDTDGLAGMLEITHTNADLLDPKNIFTGGGQRIRLYGMAGTERLNAGLDFTEPWLFGIPLRWDFSAYWRDYEYDDWDEIHLGFTTSLTKRIFDDFTSLQLGYTFEQVRIEDMEKKLKISPVFREQDDREFVGRIFLNLERDTRDSFTDSRHGYDVALYAALTTQALGASSNYFRIELKGVNYFSFFHDWFTLMAGFKVGMMDAFGGDHFVPLYDRYFLGGGDSVRGFPYRSIGPVTRVREDNYGGEFMYLATVELSHPIYKDYIRGAVFCDIGDATTRIFKFEPPNIGIGYGLRIKLPNIPMPIHLDLAYPIVNHQEDVKSRLRFHFNMGFSLL